MFLVEVDQYLVDQFVGEDLVDCFWQFFEGDFVCYFFEVVEFLLQ